MPKPPTDFSKLIPELPLWNNGAGIDVESWLGCMGNFQLAIAFSTLFWPRFVEFEDCVLFDEFSPDSFQGFMRQTRGNRAAVEHVMNHRHLLDLFSSPVGEASEKPTPEQLDYLGNILQEVWQVKLSHDFPHRKVTVVFERAAPEDLLSYIVTFYQPANEPQE